MNGERRAPTPRILLFRGDRSGSKTRLTRADLNLRIYKNGGGEYFCRKLFSSVFQFPSENKSNKIGFVKQPSIDEKEEKKRKIYIRFDLHFVFMKRFYLQHLRFQNDHLFTLLIKNQTA